MTFIAALRQLLAGYLWRPPECGGGVSVGVMTEKTTISRHPSLREASVRATWQSLVFPVPRVGSNPNGSRGEHLFWRNGSSPHPFPKEFSGVRDGLLVRPQEVEQRLQRLASEPPVKLWLDRSKNIQCVLSYGNKDEPGRSGCVLPLACCIRVKKRIEFG